VGWQAGMYAWMAVTVVFFFVSVPPRSFYGKHSNMPGISACAFASFSLVQWCCDGGSASHGHHLQGVSVGCGLSVKRPNVPMGVVE